MIDVVIPYRDCGTEVELLFTLRSLQKYVTGIDQVYIVGSCPTRVRKINYLPFSNGNGMDGKEFNLYQKVLEVIRKRPQLSDNFLYCHDDHFILEEYEAILFPAYFSGIVYGDMEKNSTPYHKTLKNTVAATGRWARNFDCHCPTVMNKERFKEELAVDWRKPYGYAIKSLYAWKTGIEGEYMDDCKFSKPERYITIKENLAMRSWFSTYERAINKDMITILQELYPEPSRWEV